jgi:Leucine-rich repeat (LRR) protein
MDNSIQLPAPPSMTNVMTATPVSPDVATPPATTTTSDYDTSEAMTADPIVNPTPSPPLAVDSNPFVAHTVDPLTTNVPVVVPITAECFLQPPPPTPDHQQLQAPQPPVPMVPSTPDSSVHHNHNNNIIMQHNIMNGTTTTNNNSNDNGMDPLRAALGHVDSTQNESNGFVGSKDAYLKNGPPPNAFPQLSQGTEPVVDDNTDIESNNNHQFNNNNHNIHQYHDYGDDDDDEYQEDDLQDVDFDSNKLPLGVPSEDGDEGQDNQHHSLPASEELKLALAAQRKHASSFFSRNPKVTWGIVFGIIFILILGLSLGLTKDQRYEKRTASFHGGDERLSHMVDYLVRNGIASITSFTDVRSPQYKAVDWLAHDDELGLLIPKLAPADSDEAYDFVTRYVMAVLYYSTTGQDWKNDLSFLSKKNTCAWFQLFQPPVGQVGVLCNQSTRRIVGVSFISNNLKGSIPTEIAKLTSLTYVESIGNSLTGTIPEEMRHFTDLSTLVLAFNVLTGTIPHWIMQWKKMEFLYLSNNLLTGTIPPGLAETTTLSVLALDDNNLRGSVDLIWRLKNLQYVYLEDNDFTGTMPQLIEPNHPQLINLDVSNNRLKSKLPKDLFRLSRLEILDLHGNAFTGNIPSDINADNLKLSFVALQENELFGPLPATLGNLKHLTHLDVSSNSLTGSIPLEFGYLKEMSFLFLAANDFTKGTIPSWVFSMNKLKELSLKSTKRTGTISYLIGALDQLVLLDLDDNELTGTIPPDIGLMSNLEFLLLNRNELSSLVPEELADLSSLRFLLLDNNHLLGDLTNVCNKIGTLKTAFVDCGEVFCPDECCDCCIDGEPCHSFDKIPSLDPIWEAGYQRQFFDFSTDGSIPFSATDDDTISLPP